MPLSSPDPRAIDRRGALVALAALLAAPCFVRVQPRRTGLLGT